MKLRRGITREVFLIGRYAIKIPSFRSWRMFLRGLLANLQEWEFSGCDPCLCPVLFCLCGGWVLVMPRCREIGYVPAEFRGMLFKGVPADLKPENFGVLDGRVVCLDYGS